MFALPKLARAASRPAPFRLAARTITAPRSSFSTDFTAKPAAAAEASESATSENATSEPTSAESSEEGTGSSASKVTSKSASRAKPVYANSSQSSKSRPTPTSSRSPNARGRKNGEAFSTESSTAAPEENTADTKSSSSSDPAAKDLSAFNFTPRLAPASKFNERWGHSQDKESLRESIAAAVDVDWTTSYHGAGTVAVSPSQYSHLVAPLPLEDIEVKPDGVLYLPEIKYRRRLNETFGPMGWSLIPRGDASVGDNIVTRDYVLIVGGRFVSQAQGENQFFSADQLPSSVEGCKSNALMRCCKDLGIASELWDPVFLRWFKEKHMTSSWVEHSTTKKKRIMWFRKGQVSVAYPWKVTKSA